MKSQLRFAAVIAGFIVCAGMAAGPGFEVGALGAQGGGRGAPAPDPTKPHRLEVVAGSKARYRVREQLAGINFPNDAVGSTDVEIIFNLHQIHIRNSHEKSFLAKDTYKKQIDKSKI
jgi:hypothetical protein